VDILNCKNKEREIDRDVSRLINSFLYSRKERRAITYNALRIMHAFIDQLPHNQAKTVRLWKGENIFEALVKVFIEEKHNTDISRVSLHLASTFVTLDDNGTAAASVLTAPTGDFTFLRHGNDLRRVCFKFVNCGICEALMGIMKFYISDQDKINFALKIVIFASIVSIKDLIAAGLLEVLSQVYNFSYHNRVFGNIVKILCLYDNNITYVFYKLGIPRVSSCFNWQTTNPNP
jgi:hypothetical protein